MGTESISGPGTFQQAPGPRRKGQKGSMVNGVHARPGKQPPKSTGHTSDGRTGKVHNPDDSLNITAGQYLNGLDPNKYSGATGRNWVAIDDPRSAELDASRESKAAMRLHQAEKKAGRRPLSSDSLQAQIQSRKDQIHNQLRIMTQGFDSVLPGEGEFIYGTHHNHIGRDGKPTELEGLEGVNREMLSAVREAREARGGGERDQAKFDALDAKLDRIRMEQIMRARFVKDDTPEVNALNTQLSELDGDIAKYEAHPDLVRVKDKIQAAWDSYLQLSKQGGNEEEILKQRALLSDLESQLNILLNEYGIESYAPDVLQAKKVEIHKQLNSQMEKLLKRNYRKLGEKLEGVNGHIADIQGSLINTRRQIDEIKQDFSEDDDGPEFQGTPEKLFSRTEVRRLTRVAASQATKLAHFQSIRKDVMFKRQAIERLSNGFDTDEKMSMAKQLSVKEDVLRTVLSDLGRVKKGMKFSFFMAVRSIRTRKMGDVALYVKKFMSLLVEVKKLKKRVVRALPGIRSLSKKLGVNREELMLDYDQDYKKVSMPAKVKQLLARGLNPVMSYEGVGGGKVASQLKGVNHYGAVVSESEVQNRGAVNEDLRAVADLNAMAEKLKILDGQLNPVRITADDTQKMLEELSGVFEEFEATTKMMDQHAEKMKPYDDAEAARALRLKKAEADHLMDTLDQGSLNHLFNQSTLSDNEDDIPGVDPDDMKGLFEDDSSSETSTEYHSVAEYTQDQLDRLMTLQDDIEAMGPEEYARWADEVALLTEQVERQDADFNTFVSDLRDYGARLQSLSETVRLEEIDNGFAQSIKILNEEVAAALDALSAAANGNPGAGVSVANSSVASQESVTEDEMGSVTEDDMVITDDGKPLSTVPSVPAQVARYNAELDDIIDDFDDELYRLKNDLAGRQGNRRDFPPMG